MTALRIEEGIHRDGKPWVHPLTRAAWRTWLSANHQTSSGVHLVTWRTATGKPGVTYGESVEEALCVGWIDSKAGKLDVERSLLWYTSRRPRSGWSRPNKERIERLTAAGLMLPAGLAAIEDARQRGTWTMLDDVEDLVVPADLAAAFDVNPPAQENWDAFSRSGRRGILEWIVQAKRPETRARRVEETAVRAARNEKANQWVPPSERSGQGSSR
ncbi:MAG: YdeI/OmpD-associated family protein [Candidatus Limnocylindrales bacterium]